MRLFNAVSLNMISGREGRIVFKEISVTDATLEISDAISMGHFESCIGHDSLASLLTAFLGLKIETNRVSVTLGPDMDLVAQYVGPRLPEGVTELPEGATIKWYRVKVVYKD